MTKPLSKIIKFGLYFEIKNVFRDTLDSIVPTNAHFRSTERIVLNGAIAAMRHVMCRQVVEISQLSQRVRDFEFLLTKLYKIDDER